MNIRMTEDLRDELQRLATAHKRTLSDYVRILLEEHVDRQKEEEAPTRRKPERER